MESSRAKVAGPLAAAGAVSVGLIIIGACGVGEDHTYVSPPPIKSDPAAVAPAPRSDSSTTTAAVLIPPSPTWRVASEPPPGPDRSQPETTTESSTDRSTDETGRTNYPPPSRSIYETSRDPTTSPSPSTGNGYDTDRNGYHRSSTTTSPTSSRVDMPFQYETTTSAQPTYGRTSTGATENTTTEPTRSTAPRTSSGTYPLETETSTR